MALLILGAVLLTGAKGDFDRAIAAYTKAIELNPDYGAYYNRGVAYKSKDDSERAVADFTKAIELNRNFAEAYFNRGEIYRGRDDFERAIEDHDIVIRLKPEFAQAYLYRGLGYCAKGDFDHAAADFTKAIEFNFGPWGLLLSRDGVVTPERMGKCQDRLENGQGQGHRYHCCVS